MCRQVSFLQILQLPDFFGIIYLLHVAESFWEANRISASQEIPDILLNPAVHYRIYKCPPPASNLSQVNPVHHIPLPDDPS